MSTNIYKSTKFVIAVSATICSSLSKALFYFIYFYNVVNGVLTAPWVMTDLNTKIRQIGPQISPVNSGSFSKDSLSLKLLVLLSSCLSRGSSSGTASSATFSGLLKFA